MDCVGFITFRFQLGEQKFDVVLLHKFDVVKELPVDIISQGELLRHHECIISFLLM